MVLRVSAARTVQPAGARRRAMSVMRDGGSSGAFITGCPSESCTRSCSVDNRHPAGRIVNSRSPTPRDRGPVARSGA